MIILHAGLLNDEVVLWAEESFPAQKFTSLDVVKRGRRGGRHPYACSYAKLLQAIDPAAVPAEMDTCRAATVQVWLPSTEQLPVPSSRLLCADDFEMPSPVKHLSWIVDTVSLHALEIVSLVERADRGHILSPGIILGAEFSYIIQLARFGAALVARQQYLPGVMLKGDIYYGRWKPVLTPADRDAFQGFTELMPPVVRALNAVPSSTAEIDRSAPTPYELVSNYVTAFVDDSVRQASSRVVTSMYLSKNKYLSVHDCWMHSLSTASGRMNFDDDEIKKFVTELEEWERPLLISEYSQFRLCFRLDEPPPGEPVSEKKSRTSTKENDACTDKNWRVHYLLQCVNDQSLLIPAEDAWLNTGAVKKTFDSANFNPREQLLRSLGMASRLSDRVGESLKSPTPSGFALDNTGAFQFLTETVPALEQAGFGVMLPAWWRKGEKAKLKKKANIGDGTESGAEDKTGNPEEEDIARRVKGRFGAENVFYFDWELALGDETLSEDELMTLASLKTPLVKIRGQWVLVSKEDIKAAIEFLQKKARKKARLDEIVKLALTGATEDGTEVEVNAQGWVRKFLAKLTAPQVMSEVSAPDAFAGELRDYQKRGYSWLNFLSQFGMGACLADDMGLGKTIQTLALIQKYKNEGVVGPTLLVCPTSVVSNWVREASKFSPDLRVMVHHGGKRKKGATFLENANQNDIVISSYGLLDRDLEQLQKVEWSGLVLDEAQNIKNYQTKQAAAARSLRSLYRIALTGTPVENSVTDLYSIMDFLNPNLLGSLYSFRDQFLIPIQVDRSHSAQLLLKSITQPFILRRLKTDKSIINDLPDKMEMKVFCSLTREQVTLYTAVVDSVAERMAQASNQERLAILLSGVVQMKQVCNHPAHFAGDNSALEGRSGKLERLIEMLEEILRCGEKALIFTQFAEMGKLLKQHLQEKFGEEVLFLHGGTPRKLRDQMVERFQSQDGPSLFVLSLKAGGTGLNLTAANHVFHYDRWWNPAVENQASDRAFRIGQKKNVQVHKFITAGTLEEKIDKLIEEKQKTADVVVGSGEAWISQMSNEDLKKLFKLSDEVSV
ncbi:MAG: DEAD/DEAH box helicase [Candidatus Melainabacteria bacterium]|nr:MAG: DEAD/DEAH box helicase [Candidatus Melainabacteria bacterium]